MQFRIFVLFIISSLCVHAYGIGRTGNKTSQGYAEIGDTEDGFLAGMPPIYSIAQPMGAGNMRYRANVFEATHPIVPSQIELLHLSSVFPEFQGQSRTDLNNKLISDGWVRLSSADPCLDLFQLSGNNTIAGLAFWGDSKGLVVRALEGHLNDGAVQAILTTLQLTPGACAWK